MSQIYLKRCDKCGKLSPLANTPNPPGWQSMADMVHGTLAVIDFCPECLDTMGIRAMLTQRVRDRAVGALKAMIPDALPDMRASLGMDEIEAAILSGEYDDAFDSGDGINLAAASDATRITDAELVSGE